MICEGWEGSTIDGKFPLLEWLGGWADHCVFLTVRQGTQRANIKLIPATGADADAHLAYWETARSLSHPSLLQLMESGRCTIHGTDVVYVLTERADTFLSAIILRKPLKPSEVKLILDPVVDALMFLHENGFGHGSVRPSNIVLVNGEWKLTSEKMASGEVAGRKPDEYNAPEVAAGELTPAADVWSLGMILVEAFEQRTPSWDAEAKKDPEVPDSLPEPFLEIARGCLRREPEKRASIVDVKALLARDTMLPSGAASIPHRIEPVPIADAPVTKAPTGKKPAEKVAESWSDSEPVEFAPRSRMFTNLEEEEERTGRKGSIVLAMVILLVAAGAFVLRNYWGQLLHLGQTQNTPAQNQTAPQTQAPQNEAAPNPATPAPASPAGPANPSQSGSSESAPPGASAPESQPAPAATKPQEPAKSALAGPPVTKPEIAAPKSKEEKPAPETLNSKGEVLKRVLPNVELGASEGMRRGSVDVELRVSVKEDGTVSNVEYMTQGPGNYFARKARQAAKSWKFKPPESEGQATASEWVLLFRFERRKVDVTATEMR